jgi:hypothetical protein
MEPRAVQPQNQTDSPQELPYARHPDHRSSGVFGHWTRTLGALAPLVITELIPEDRAKQSFIRIASVALAATSEASYAYPIQRERKERDEERRGYGPRSFRCQRFLILWP